MGINNSITKPDLIILATTFPASDGKSEMWLENELNITFSFYNNILLFSETDITTPLIHLPKNCSYQKMDAFKNETLSFLDYWTILNIVLTDFFSLFKRRVFLKELKYNLSLIKTLYKKAKFINKSIANPNSILYAYWADNLATTACIIKLRNKKVKVISRAHGYEIFEELKKNKIIPFRNFHNTVIDKIIAVSMNGFNHLNKKYPDYKSKYDYSYLGTNDFGLGKFIEGSDFAIVTCAFLNPIKRLTLLPLILKHIDFDLTWHVLGDGPEKQKISDLCKDLGKNIKVIFHGALSNNAILDFYKYNSINLFIGLSFSEGLPVSMMEAQSFGIPILSTDVGGCREICTQDTGILIPRDFLSNEVAAKISDFRKSEKNMLSFRKKCRDYWKTNFNAETNYKKFAEKIILSN